MFLGCSDSNKTSNEIDADIGVATTHISKSLRSSVKSNEIEISWDADEDAIAYYIEWGKSREYLHNSEYMGEDKRVFKHKNLNYDTIYYYRLKTDLDYGDESVYSAIVAVKSGDKEQILQSDAGI